MLNLGKKAYESAIASRRTWNEVFGTKQGKAVFTAILNRLGFFSVIPEKVKPENMVVANWMLNQMGVQSPAASTLQLKNVAAVSVTANLPAFARPGQLLDVTVSSIGTPKVYAVACCYCRL